MLRNKITKYLFYSNLGVWGIGSDYKNPDKGVIQSERSGLAEIPKTGWRYKQGRAWRIDPDLKVIGNWEK